MYITDSYRLLPCPTTCRLQGPLGIWQRCLIGIGLTDICTVCSRQFTFGVTKMNVAFTQNRNMDVYMICMHTLSMICNYFIDVGKKSPGQSRSM